MSRTLAEGPEGCLLWLNLFGWTYNPRTPMRHLPFVTWPIQDRVVRELWRAVASGQDRLIDKSRDMGASWLCVSVLTWWLQFRADTPLLLVSRKEDYVDSRGNPDCLMWKVRYLLKHQPAWLAPAIRSRHMHVENLDNGSVIDGESTNADVARGGRRKAILLDEFAAVDNGAEILAATADATPCRIFNSTPKGRGNAFADVRFSGKVKVITLPWWEHPDKGRGRRRVEGPDGRLRWTSPWYQAERARRTSPREIAQELDIDYLASGEMFFDSDVLGRIRGGGQLAPPTARGELAYTVDTLAEGRAYRLALDGWRVDAGRRRLGLWCDLPGGAPREDDNYAAFCDVSAGTGASNSVLKVARLSDRSEVADLVASDLSPPDFARYAVAVCRFFAGRTGGALLGWEANGPGQIFGGEVHRLGYPRVLGNPDPMGPWDSGDGRIGWWSSRDRKLQLLGDLRSALARDELILRDEATVAEIEQYVFYPSGGVGPARLTSEPDGARAAHGDRVIAAAGLLLCMRHQARALPRPPRAGRFSPADLRRRHQQTRRRETQW